jgi:ABC-type xylose transport system permease subunit
MKCLKIKLNTVTAVTAVVVVMVVVAAAVLYLLTEIKKCRKIILMGEN